MNRSVQDELKNFVPDNTESLLRHLAWQLDRMNVSIDKICNRLEILEADYSDRTLKKKIINILFATYPILMILILLFSNTQSQKIDTVYQESQELLQNVSTLVANRD